MGILSWGFGEWKQRFSDCVAEVYAILCSCKGTQAESAYAESAQESTLRGFRREVSPDLLRQTEMKSKAGAQGGSAPLRTPGERASRERQTTEMLCTAEKVHVFRAKNGKGGTLSFGI